MFVCLFFVYICAVRELYVYDRVLLVCAIQKTNVGASTLYCCVSVYHSVCIRALGRLPKSDGDGDGGVHGDGRLPKGRALAQNLLLLLSERLSTTGVQLSYKQCERGTREAGQQCVNCTAGRHSGRGCVCAALVGLC